MNVTTIVLVDDHHLVRQGISALLKAEKDFSVIGETSDGLTAVRLVQRLSPRVLILDLMIPALNGIEVTRRIRQCCPGTHVLILSMYDSEAYVLEAFRNGADGYILKDSTPNDLVAAIREVIAGRRYLGSSFSRQRIEAYALKSESAHWDRYETLTAREREVFQLAAEGQTSAEIAAKLFISPRTVEAHRAAMMRKLGIHTQSKLVRYAVARGILPLS